MRYLYYFLGIKVTTLSNGDLVLSQTKYIQELLTKAKMDLCKPSHSPMVSFPCLDVHLDKPLYDNPSFYRSLGYAFQYITLKAQIFVIQ